MAADLTPVPEKDVVRCEPRNSNIQEQWWTCGDSRTHREVWPNILAFENNRKNALHFHFAIPFDQEAIIVRCPEILIPHSSWYNETDFKRIWTLQKYEFGSEFWFNDTRGMTKYTSGSYITLDSGVDSMKFMAQSFERFEALHKWYKIFKGSLGLDSKYYHCNPQTNNVNIHGLGHRYFSIHVTQRFRNLHCEIILPNGKVFDRQKYPNGIPIYKLAKHLKHSSTEIRFQCECVTPGYNLDCSELAEIHVMRNGMILSYSDLYKDFSISFAYENPRSSFQQKANKLAPGYFEQIEDQDYENLFGKLNFNIPKVQMIMKFNTTNFEEIQWTKFAGIYSILGQLRLKNDFSYHSYPLVMIPMIEFKVDDPTLRTKYFHQEAIRKLPIKFDFTILIFNVHYFTVSNGYIPRIQPTPPQTPNEENEEEQRSTTPVFRWRQHIDWKPVKVESWQLEKYRSFFEGEQT